MAKIALVVNSTTHAATTNTKAMLERIGHVVTVVAESNITTHDFSVYDVVTGARVSPTANFKHVLDTYKKPVLIGTLNSGHTELTAQNSVLANLRIGGNVNVEATFSQIRVTDNTHPITTGFSTTAATTVYTANSYMAEYNSAAARVGTELSLSQGTSPTMGGGSDSYAVDKGTLDLDGNPVPARIYASGAFYGGQGNYTAAADTLFKQAIEWLLASAGVGATVTAAVSSATASAYQAGRAITVNASIATAIGGAYDAGAVTKTLFDVNVSAAKAIATATARGGIASVEGVVTVAATTVTASARSINALAQIYNPVVVEAAPVVDDPIYTEFGRTSTGALRTAEVYFDSTQFPKVVTGTCILKFTTRSTRDWNYGGFTTRRLYKTPSGEFNGTEPGPDVYGSFDTGTVLEVDVTAHLEAWEAGGAMDGIHLRPVDDTTRTAVYTLDPTKPITLTISGYTPANVTVSASKATAVGSARKATLYSQAVRIFVDKSTAFAVGRGGTRKTFQWKTDLTQPRPEEFDVVFDYYHPSAPDNAFVPGVGLAPTADLVWKKPDADMYEAELLTKFTLNPNWQWAKYGHWIGSINFPSLLGHNPPKGPLNSEGQWHIGTERGHRPASGDVEPWAPDRLGIKFESLERSSSDPGYDKPWHPGSRPPEVVGLVKVVDGVYTTGSIPTPKPGEQWYLRFRTRTALHPTLGFLYPRLFVRLWREGEPEPSEWTYTFNDATTPIPDTQVILPLTPWGVKNTSGGDFIYVFSNEYSGQEFDPDWEPNPKSSLHVPFMFYSYIGVGFGPGVEAPWPGVTVTDVGTARATADANGGRVPQPDVTVPVEGTAKATGGARQNVYINPVYVTITAAVSTASVRMPEAVADLTLRIPAGVARAIAYSLYDHNPSVVINAAPARATAKLRRVYVNRPAVPGTKFYVDTGWLSTTVETNKNITTKKLEGI